MIDDLDIIREYRQMKQRPEYLFLGVEVFPGQEGNVKKLKFRLEQLFQELDKVIQQEQAFFYRVGSFFWRRDVSKDL